MHLIDLTHTIHDKMPVYPGTEAPRIEIGCSIAEHGFLEKRLHMFSHTGTHMDAPAHMIAGGRYLDDYPPEHFMGMAVVLDVRGLDRVETSALEAFASVIAGMDFVLLRTGWSAKWGQDGYFEGFPVLTAAAARWLAAQGLKGLGVDAISVDPVEKADYAVHMALLGSGMVLIENLTSLDRLPDVPFHFCCLPLRLHQSDGSPVRAIAWMD